MQPDDQRGQHPGGGGLRHVPGLPQLHRGQLGVRPRRVLGRWRRLRLLDRHLRTTAEWTFTDESTTVAFPSGWSSPDATALFFANAPARCQLAWQFSGGNGDVNPYGGDYDQFDGNHASVTKCE